MPTYLPTDRCAGLLLLLLLLHQRDTKTTPLLFLLLADAKVPAAEDCGFSSQQEKPQSSAAASMPEQVVEQLLHFLPQQQRLSSAALVSRSWAKAAAAATTDIVVTCNNARVASLNEWLKLHAAHVRSIQVARRLRKRRSCAPLKLPGDLLTRLTSLHLHECPAQVYSAQPCVMMPALNTLVLTQHKAPTKRKFLMPLLVPHLTALELSDTMLESYFESDREVLQHLTSLTNLQSCVMTGEEDFVDPGALSFLCSSLTSLSFTPQTMAGSFTADMVPAAGWPLLKQLRVHNTALRGQLLARLTAQEVLHLECCDLCPEHDVGAGDRGIAVQHTACSLPFCRVVCMSCVSYVMCVAPCRHCLMLALAWHVESTADTPTH